MKNINFQRKKRGDFARYDQALTYTSKEAIAIEKTYFQNIFFSHFFFISKSHGQHACGMFPMPNAWSPCLRHGTQSYGIVPKPSLWSPMHAAWHLSLWPSTHVCSMVSMPAAWFQCLKHNFHACGMISMPLHGIHACGMVINPNPDLNPNPNPLQG